MIIIIKKTLKKIFPNLFRFLKIIKLKKELPEIFINNLNELNCNSLVIDLGANIGLISEILAETKANVIAFEPNRSAFKELKKLKKKYKNITIHQKAAGVTDCQRKLYLHKFSSITKEDYSQASSLLEDKSNINKNKFQFIDEINFVNYLRSLNQKVDLIKIDIEGYEIKLIEHLINSNVLHLIDKFYVETHENKIISLKDETSKLKLKIKKMGLNKKFYFNWH